MKKLKDEELMDYVEGTLDARRLAEVEEFLQQNPEEAALVADMKLAMSALHEWHEAEPVRVSDDFWVKVREQLPEKPGRSFARSFGAQLKTWLWPAHSPLHLSARVMAVVVVVAMMASLLSPQKATRPVVAEGLTSADKTFIQQSLNRHSAYVSSQPFNSSINLPVGDGRDGDGDGEDGGNEDDENYTP